MKITIRDVARESGVSVSTVSRVINNNYPVKKETREKIEKAIEKLNFNPNFLARGLIHQKTNTIGVIVPSITNLFFPTVVKAIERIFRKEGYSIFLCDTNNQAEEEVNYIKSLLSRQVDGIIVIDPRTENMKSGFYEKITKEIPLVCINGYNEGIDCNFVLNDEESGAQEALEYLISLGHTEIGFVRGEKSYSYDLKEEVYKKILDKYNLLEAQCIINIGKGNSDETVDNTSEKIYSVLQNLKRPTAFFACNDLMALGIVNACKKMELKVPQHISVIGFDNIIISSILEPKLTTVDQNIYALGDNAAKMLLTIIRGESRSMQKLILNTQLVLRNSCKEKR